MFYLDDRQYKTFQIGALLRERDINKEAYKNTWNYRYTCNLVPVSNLISDLTSESTFYIT